jgi:hypothetical protein
MCCCDVCGPWFRAEVRRRAEQWLGEIEGIVLTLTRGAPGVLNRPGFVSGYFCWGPAGARRGLLAS